MSSEYSLCKVLNRSGTIDLVLFEDERCVLFNLDEKVKTRFKESLSIINKYLGEMSRKHRVMEEADRELLEIGYSEKEFSIRFSNLIGAILYGSLRIWFVPKIYGESEFSTDELMKNTMHIMYHMSSYVGGYYRRISRTILKRSEPYGFLSELYINKLSSELKRGVYREYVKVASESIYVKGKLMLTDLVKKYPHEFQKLISQHWLLSIDNPLNKVLYVATRKALGFTRSRDARSQAVEIINLLRDVEGPESTILSVIPLVVFNRLNERFRETFFLAKLILGYTGVIGREALLFIQNTPELFEKYVFKILKRKLAEFDVRYQYEIVNSICCADRINRSRVPIPDIVIRTRDEVIPIDVKYKVARSCDDVSTQDIYQIAFYARVLSSSKAVLVYPSIHDNHPIHIEIRKTKSIENNKLVSEKDLDIYIVYYNFSNIIKEDRIDNRFVKNIEKILRT